MTSYCTMQITANVGPPTARGDSPNPSVVMASSLRTDVGTDDTTGTSEAPGTPPIQVCLLCTTDIS